MYNYNNATDQDRFNKDLQSLLDGLRVRAAGGGARWKFATGNVTGPDLVTIMALMQCTPDLSQKECSDCLVLSMGQISRCSDGKVGGIVFWPSCTLRYEIYPFYGDVPSTEEATPPPSLGPVPKSPLASSTVNQTSTAGKSNNKTKRIIVVISSSVASIMVLILCICLFLKKWKLRKPEKKTETSDQNESCTGDDIKTVESMQYDFSTLCAATDNFSDDNKLGLGGFGVVYKGVLPNGLEIAVKRLSQNSHQGEIEFKNEVMLVAKLQHRNLVQLLGFCYKQTERLLIYEFMTNSSLDSFLFDSVKRTVLDWEKRYKIIGGVARGLLYLHEDSRLRIIHRDLKASNVLLDNDMNPKISDFGMARLFETDETHGSTTRIVGTYGYMAPEYAMHGHFSVKSDVFSFGVLILEIVSGQKNCHFRKGEMEKDLLSYTWNSWRQGRALDLVDPSLMSTTNSTREMVRCIHIGLLCVQENPVDRPTMVQVGLMLTSMSLTLPVPSQPAFFLDTNVSHEMPREYDSEATDQSSDLRYKFIPPSDNEASITELYPR